MTLITENSGIRFIKISLVFFNIIQIITGISLIIVGSTINEIFVEFSTFLGKLYCTPATILVFVGFITFGIAGIGCVGAFRENVGIITAFGILLGIAAFMQAGSGMLNHFLSDEISQVTRDHLNSTMIRYQSDSQAQTAMDYLQRELNCCGLSSAEDWTNPLYGNGSAPESCCGSYFQETKSCDYVFHIGCHPTLNTVLMEGSRILTFSAYLLSVTQVFGMLFAFYLARMLREQKLARNYRRWIIRNQLLGNPTGASDSYYSSCNSFDETFEKSKITFS